MVIVHKSSLFSLLWLPLQQKTQVIFFSTLCKQAQIPLHIFKLASRAQFSDRLVPICWSQYYKIFWVGRCACRSHGVIISHMVFTDCTTNADLVHVSNCNLDDEGITMIDSEFNSYANGPAITIESGCHLEIEHGLFLNHWSNISVIQILDGAQVTIKDSHFDGNHMSNAIVAKGAFLRIQQCNFPKYNAVNRSAVLLNLGDVAWSRQRENVKVLNLAMIGD